MYTPMSTIVTQQLSKVFFYSLFPGSELNYGVAQRCSIKDQNQEVRSGAIAYVKRNVHIKMLQSETN